MKVDRDEQPGYAQLQVPFSFRTPHLAISLALGDALLETSDCEMELAFDANDVDRETLLGPASSGDRYPMDVRDGPAVVIGGEKLAGSEYCGNELTVRGS